MPVPTPWIRSYDVPGEFTKGYGLGMQGAEANARMQLQANQMAQQAALEQERLAQRQQEVILETETRKEIAQKQMLMEQARADITRAYHESQIGLQRERLNSAARLADLKVKQAARTFEADERAKSRIQAGEDPYKVLLEEGAGAGESMTGLAAVMRAGQANLPESLVTQTKEGRTFFQRGGKWYSAMQAPQVGQLDSKQIDSINRSILAEETYQRNVAETQEAKNESQMKVLDLKRQKNEIYRRAGQPTPHPEAEEPGAGFEGARQVGKYKVMQVR